MGLTNSRVHRRYQQAFADWKPRKYLTVGPHVSATKSWPKPETYKYPKAPPVPRGYNFAKPITGKRIPLSKPTNIKRQYKPPAPEEPGFIRNVYNRIRHNVATRWNNVDPTLNATARGLGAAAGAYLGGPTGLAFGSEIADYAHRAFKTVTGYGDYKVNSNSLTQDSVPSFNIGQRFTNVKHREYIRDVITSATALTFTVDKYSINPGDLKTFPWLSTIAAQYEEYKIKGLIFEFKSTSCDALNSVNTALGTVVMATQYNVLNPPFSAKQQMENYEFGSSCKPSQSLMHPIECAPHETPNPELFVRTPQSVIIGADLRLYDHGAFYIATTGMQGTSVNVGELWVTYDVDLLKPKLSNVVADTTHIKLNPTATTSNYFGAPIGGVLPAPTSTSNLPVTVNTANNGLYFDPSFSGNVMIQYSVHGTSTVGAVAPSVNGTGPTVTKLNLFNIANADYAVVPPAATTTDILGVYCFNINGGGGLLFTGGVFPTASTWGDCIITTISVTN